MSEDLDDIHNRSWSEIEKLLKEIASGFQRTVGIEVSQDKAIAESLRNYSPEEKDEFFREIVSDADEVERSVDLVLMAIRCRNKTLLKKAIARTETALYGFPEIFSFEVEEMFRISNDLNIENCQLIYSLDDHQIIVPEIIVPAQQDIAEIIRKTPSVIYSISPRDFEELIAEVFDKRGFNVELTKETRDGGKDIIAIGQHMGIDVKFIVECKRYARERKVTLDLVQRLYGVKLAEQANKAILVTTSSFTKDSIRFASQHRWDISLRDCEDVFSWLNEK
jgi:hypothetical protein